MCDFMGICEVASSAAGYSPELSYGSHLFQDLVEADIYYGALLENPKLVHYNPEFVGRFTEATSDIFGESALSEQEKRIIHVYETGEVPLTLWHDLATSTSLCGCAE